ncbi:ML domain-containing protein [Mycotypha africana]|uniref:ML domain-containing protein n=1 Tax=Mycotypha africana TaxID=64632 RepID=UPI0023010809|nr:ML domain-containing protein [Mycotypha africana]KAI8975498.1 ML domain-containing protein [Mycotypha africana]
MASTHCSFDGSETISAMQTYRKAEEVLRMLLAKLLVLHSQTMKICLTAAALLLVLTAHNVSARFFYLPSYFYHYTSSVDNKSPFSPAQEISSSSTLFIANGISNVEIENCGIESDRLHIRDIKISPEIVVPGGELTIEATGTLKEDVGPGAEAIVDVKLGRIKLLHRKFDICDELKKNEDKVELQCPIQEGDLTVTQKITLPKEIPRAKFLVDVLAYTSNDDDLACLRIAVDFRVRRRHLSSQFWESEEPIEFGGEDED